MQLIRGIHRGTVESILSESLNVDARVRETRSLACLCSILKAQKVSARKSAADFLRSCTSTRERDSTFRFSLRTHSRRRADALHHHHHRMLDARCGSLAVSVVPFNACKMCEMCAGSHSRSSARLEGWNIENLHCRMFSWTSEGNLALLIASQIMIFKIGAIDIYLLNHNYLSRVSFAIMKVKMKCRRVLKRAASSLKFEKSSTCLLKIGESFCVSPFFFC